MLIADIIKSSMIVKKGYKGSLIVEEVGLPLEVEWTKTHRADLMELTKDNKVIIYEVKSCMADYRSDNKWQEYLNHCNLLYFIAPSEVAKVIKSEVPNHVGVYEMYKSGYLHCIRVARKTQYIPDVEIVKNKLHTQLAYRYAKIHSLKIKKVKESKNG
jgi:hypothetical protein